MAHGDLTQAEFDIAFAFARSEEAGYLDGNGDAATAAVDDPRFDHDEDGASLGLLVTPGADFGGRDRIAIDPLMLPTDLFDFSTQGASDATIFHRFRPTGSDEHLRSAWYTRHAQAAIDALLLQQGHHAELGVVRGFRENMGGFVRLRGQVWPLTGLLAAGAAVLEDGTGRPVITDGAMPPEG